MSWSFQIRNGDLNWGGPGGFATVSGRQKLIQDLRNWLTEPRGTDSFHPDYGSVLDGGIGPTGTEVDYLIGNVVSEEGMMQIEAEVRRILAAYQQQQSDRLNNDIIKYSGKNTFGLDEILLQVEDVTVENYQDVVLVTVTLLTGSGNQISFTSPVASI